MLAFCAGCWCAVQQRKRQKFSLKNLIFRKCFHMSWKEIQRKYKRCLRLVSLEDKVLFFKPGYMENRFKYYISKLGGGGGQSMCWFCWCEHEQNIRNQHFLETQSLRHQISLIRFMNSMNFRILQKIIFDHFNINI